MKSQNYLGIDWGSAKLGIALAHGETKTALAYATLPNDATLESTLRRILHDEAVGTIVIGLPKRRSESAGQSTHPAQAFGERLAERFALPVVFADEMFTSRLAQDVLVAQGYKESSQKDDAEAAKILLQDWLDRSESR